MVLWISVKACKFTVAQRLVFFIQENNINLVLHYNAQLCKTKNFLEIEENKSLTPNLTYRATSLVKTNIVILVLELFSGTEAKCHKVACLHNVRLF